MHTPTALSQKHELASPFLGCAPCKPASSCAIHPHLGDIGVDDARVHGRHCQLRVAALQLIGEPQLGQLAPGGGSGGVR